MTFNVSTGFHIINQKNIVFREMWCKTYNFEKTIKSGSSQLLLVLHFTFYL